MNLAQANKKQTDAIIRQRELSGRAESAVVGGGVGGADPSISNPASDLSAHKASGDHDSRYYTETELNAGQLDTRYYTEAEVNGLIAAMPVRYAEDFENAASIVATHNLGKRPLVQVIGQAPIAYGAGLFGAGAYGGLDDAGNAVLAPSSIVHDSVDQVTITLAAAATGEVVCIG